MAYYSVREIWQHLVSNPFFDRPNTLLFMRNFVQNPASEEDTRPEFLRFYVDTNINDYGKLDFYIANKYGEYLYCRDSEDVEQATINFAIDNFVNMSARMNEMQRIYDAFTTDFNPLENYDRIEETTVNTDMSTGGTSKTAPDDSETFYNVGSADSTTEGDVTTDSHIHGNIGVTTAPAMIGEVERLFSKSSWFDVFVRLIIQDACMLVD